MLLQSLQGRIRGVLVFKWQHFSTTEPMQLVLFNDSSKVTSCSLAQLNTSTTVKVCLLVFLLAIRSAD